MRFVVCTLVLAAMAAHLATSHYRRGGGSRPWWGSGHKGCERVIKHGFFNISPGNSTDNDNSTMCTPEACRANFTEGETEIMKDFKNDQAILEDIGLGNTGTVCHVKIFKNYCSWSKTTREVFSCCEFTVALTAAVEPKKDDDDDDSQYVPYYRG